MVSQGRNVRGLKQFHSSRNLLQPQDCLQSRLPLLFEIFKCRADKYLVSFVHLCLRVTGAATEASGIIIVRFNDCNPMPAVTVAHNYLDFPRGRHSLLLATCGTLEIEVLRRGEAFTVYAFRRAPPAPAETIEDARQTARRWSGCWGSRLGLWDRRQWRPMFRRKVAPHRMSDT